MTQSQVCLILELNVITTPSFSAALSALFFLSPIIADSTLLVRVCAVYPPSALSRPKFIAIYPIVALLKVARFLNMVIGSVILQRMSHRGTDPIASGATSWTLPFARIEWFLGTFDTTLSISVIA